MDRIERSLYKKLLDEWIVKATQVLSLLESSEGAKADIEKILTLSKELDAIDARIYELPIGFWAKRKKKNWHKILQRDIKDLINLKKHIT